MGSLSSSEPGPLRRNERTEDIIDEKDDPFDIEERSRGQLSAIFENPFEKFTKEKVLSDVEIFCKDFELSEYLEDFRKAALVSKSPHKIHEIEELDSDDIAALEREHTHKWSQPWHLYWLVAMCSIAAAVQGMDESVNNGAQTFYLRQFDIRVKSKGGRFDQGEYNNLVGLIVGAPYLACAVLGCWLTQPLNRFFARRGTIFITCFVAAFASIWEAFADSWVNLFIARFVLGLGIGAKSATVPIYSAECAPAPIRGALVMMWQIWTAFGIMLGNIMGVAFYGLGPDLGWRLMLGSTVVLPLVVCAQVYFCVESPRWLIQHNKMKKAYRAFRSLRPTSVQAARDLYYAYVSIKLERKINSGDNVFTMFSELFSVPRNRRATWASWIVMFMQQFCGVNVIAYYSTVIFLSGGAPARKALLASMGTGILNFVFALPAFFTIDTWGRRNLLLVTFPFLCLTLLWTGFSFWIDSDHPESKFRIGMITTGIYLFEVFYSSGEGPVPFVYSAEAFPLHVREVGMSWAAATTWCFNFIVSFTWPHLTTAFTEQGAFSFYAAWCMIGWVLVLLFMPETKALTLEELDQVFSVPTWKHASYQIKKSIWCIRTVVLRQKLDPMPPFYQGAEKLMES